VDGVLIGVILYYHEYKRARAMVDVLLVEDDPALGRGLCVNLEHEGYSVHLATNLQSASAANKQKKFELVILDLGLPDGNGFTLLKEIRARGELTPVLILTAQTSVESVVEGLQLGANDYIRKPFDDRELLARIKTVLRKPNPQTSSLRFGDLLVLVEKRKVMVGEIEVELSPKEFDILCYFVQNSEAVVTRAALLEAVDKEGSLFDRTIDSNISHIRTRLKKSGVHSIQIVPVYGIGYRLEKS
jgi:DNA-binding response OmpR family regulator